MWLVIFFVDFYVRGFFRYYEKVRIRIESTNRKTFFFHKEIKEDL